MRSFLTYMIIGAAMLGLGLTGPAAAQGQFNPVISVNDAAISAYELDQRRRLLQFFRTPGDLDAQAREGLIDDRLRQQELNRVGLSLTPEQLNTAMEEFAGRANLSLDQFTQVLQQNGIELATLRDFVETGTTWRDYIRARFGSQVTVTDADIARAATASAGDASGIEVLLSEIIIPAPPGRQAEAQRIANQIAGFTSFAAFESAAREVSALPTRDQGGRLGWLPITNYPPQLQQLFLSLQPGQITSPLSITNGIALFQMRGVREVSATAPVPTQIDYAAYMIPAGSDNQGLRTAGQITDQIDTCDDLYGVAKDQPADRLERQELSPADIPGDIALELARLDPGEVSFNLTRDNGKTIVFLMLCSRTTAGQQSSDPNVIRNQIRSQRLTSFADALLADLRASAVIRGQ